MGSGIQIRPAVLLWLQRVLVLTIPCSWLLVQGFHRLPGELQFTLAIVKLRSTVYMAIEQRGSSGLLATQTSIVQGSN